MQFTVNGRAIDLVVDPDRPVIDILRNELGLTGTKLSCGGGTCGACTILVDGVPACACLFPASDLAGRSIRTIESLPAGAHPVQRAFMYEDALQCGYCTPGFIMQAVAFYDAWKLARGTAAPSPQEIGLACSGHLCRCGTYPHVVRAITRACTGDYDTPPAGDPPRHDAKPKVTGDAKYTVDVQLPHQLDGAILRAPHAHAEIERIDWSAAVAFPGVSAVVDLTGGSREVRYLGQEIAAVAARDLATAKRALSLIRVDYRQRPASIGAVQAMRPDAPLVYPSVFEHKPSESELPLLPLWWRGNVRGPLWLLSHKGIQADVSLLCERVASSASLVEGTWAASSQSHTPLEPHACVADWRADGSLVVHSSTQACSDLAIDIGARWNLPDGKVRVLCPFVGGAFGSKAELTAEAIAAIELSRASGHPVRVVLGSDEEFVTGGYRPAVEMNVALKMDDEGAMRAFAMTARTDGGVAIGTSVAGVCSFTYPDVPKRLSDYDVVSHLPPAKPFRGPGGPAAFWALEQTIDIAARQRRLDPVAVRRLNDPAPERAELLDWVETIPEWRQRFANAREGRFVQGIGLACGSWAYFTHSDARVTVEAGPNGILVRSGCQDIGNGSRTVLATVVANVFGLPQSSIDTHIGDSKHVAATMSSGSRTTASVGPAAELAATAVRDRLVEAARARGLNGATAVSGGVRHGDRVIPWAEILADSEKIEVTARRPRDPEGYVLPFALDGFLIGRARPSSVHVVEVEVDRQLGRVSVPKVWTGLAVGHIVVEPLARSQVIGGAIQGVSYALFEERRVDFRTGKTMTMTLDDHRLCGVADAPDVDVHFVTSGFQGVLGHAVGLGEISTLAVAAAIGNAVFDATGWRPTRLPLRPEVVLGGLKSLHA